MNAMSDLLRRRATAWLLIAAALAATGWQAAAWSADRRHDDRRAAAVEVAKAVVVDLTTMTPATVHDRLQAIKGRLADGPFKKQFVGFATTFADEVGKGKLTSAGKVVGAAVMAYSDDRASVLVASTSEVRQSTANDVEPTERYWRFKVALKRVGDTWLISRMEFVQ